VTDYWSKVIEKWTVDDFNLNLTFTLSYSTNSPKYVLYSDPRSWWRREVNFIFSSILYGGAVAVKLNG
jgi:hypothetical protein